MTTAQEDAISRVKEILSEHFEASVLVVQIEVGDKGESNPTFWHGGWALALGMCMAAQQDILRNHKNED